MTVQQIERGAILTKRAYAQGKMLDHSSWKLPRNITPSDVDMFFDNSGKVLFCELSSHNEEWSELSHGQRSGYQNIIRTGQHLAVLLTHSVPSDREINTKIDIDSFQLMGAIRGGFVYSDVEDGKCWPTLVERFYTRPNYRNILLDYMTNKDWGNYAEIQR